MKAKMREDGCSEEQIAHFEKNLVYHKCVADVRRRSQDLKDNMKSENFSHVQSKVHVHLKQKRDDNTPEKLKAKNMRHMEEDHFKKKEVKKITKNQYEQMLLSPVRQSKPTSSKEVNIEYCDNYGKEPRRGTLLSDQDVGPYSRDSAQNWRETQATYQQWNSGNSTIEHRESMNPFSPAKDTSTFNSPISSIPTKYEKLDT